MQRFVILVLTAISFGPLGAIACDLSTPQKSEDCSQPGHTDVISYCDRNTLVTESTYCDTAQHLTQPITDHEDCAAKGLSCVDPRFLADGGYDPDYLACEKSGRTACPAPHCSDGGT